MSGRALVILLVAGIGLGFSAGRLGGDEVKTVTETKVVRVPKVVTHVEYRDRYRELPESCTDAITALGSMETQTFDLTKNAGIISDQLKKLGLGYTVNDVHSINAALDVIGPAKNSLDQAAIDKAKSIDGIKTKISLCEKEVADGP